MITPRMNISGNYRLFDLSAKSDDPPLPNSPTDAEKYSYVHRNVHVLILFSIISFGCITVSTISLYADRYWLFPFFLLLCYTIVYFLFSLRINLFSWDFHIGAHRDLVFRWRPAIYPSVDVFLPTCGEPIEVLQNTWDGVFDMRRSYPGKVFVHCLDDAHSPEVRDLAYRYGFAYHARQNRGWFKKAGNLRHGFENSSADFIAIFDADFRPRHDFLAELLPYFFAHDRLGIVQSPQYFGFDPRQNWLERGAGAVQELFYRAVQVSRQTHSGAICVGSNAIYRRAALNEIGGTALIEHSEDVHTGFELRKKNWDLLYVPVVLAKGLCPSELKAFFKQQYRWCMGSMSLLTSQKFWGTKLPFTSRMCFFSGFMYYIHTAIYAVFTPVIPLVMLLTLPDEIQLTNYMLIFPSFFYIHVVLPLWHRKPQGIEAASVRVIYGWAHLFAIRDKIAGSVKEWHPTGAVHTKDANYTMFRVGVLVFNFVPALIWIGMAVHYMFSREFMDFLPIYVLGLYYFFTILKVVLYRDPAAQTKVARAPFYLHEALRYRPMMATAAE
jgi:cellulose synthase (UDP-forming)